MQMYIYPYPVTADGHAIQAVFCSYQRWVVQLLKTVHDNLCDAHWIVQKWAVLTLHIWNPQMSMLPAYFLSLLVALDGAWDSTVLTSPWVILVLLSQGPQLEQFFKIIIT